MWFLHNRIAAIYIKFLVLVFLARLSVTKIFSATMRWRRIGATPQFLSRTASGAGCGQSFNADPLNGCDSSSARTILFSVEAVFESSAFSSLPRIGTEIKTTSPCIFCSGESGDSCYPAFLEVIDVRTNIGLRNNLTLIYTQFQKLKVYTSFAANVTAVFQTISRYPKCLSTTSQNAICLAPQNGNVTSGSNRNNFCSSCVDDVANQILNLSTIVHFYDSAGARPWDTTLYPMYRLFPATNHHSPYASFLPLVTVPRLTSALATMDLLIPTVDEDGASKPVDCFDSFPDTPCSNVNFSWGMKTNRSADGLALNWHSDGTLTLARYGNGWALKRPANREGNGVEVTLVGPMVQPDRANVNPLYPLQIVFWDPMRVNVTLDFLVQICMSLAPVRITLSRLTITDLNDLPIAPVFITLGATSHDPASPKVYCYPNAPCNVIVRAVVYNTSAGSTMRRIGYCNWGVSAKTLFGSQSTMCVDNVRTVDPAQNISIDTAHAAMRTCDGVLYPGAGDGVPRALNTPRCHSVAEQTVQMGVASVNVAIFGGRPNNTQPYEFDIGRKLILCFQARSCETCCYSAPYCVTVEILGRIPSITLPVAPPTCSFANFQSDSLTSVGLVDSTKLPPATDFSSTCPHLYACWALESAGGSQPPTLPPASGLPAQYSQNAAGTRFLFRASDIDLGETVKVLPLRTDGVAPSVLDSAAVEVSAVTDHAGGCLGQSLRELWRQDPLCREGTREVRVAVGYTKSGSAGFSPVQTAVEDGYYFARFDDDKNLCVAATDNQAAKWGRGLNNTQVRCHLVRFRGPPAFIGHSTRPNDSPFVFLDGNTMWTGITTLRGWIGEDIRFTVRARDPNPADAVTILILEDPGLPTGLRVGPSTCVPRGFVDGNATLLCAEAFRNISWTPRAGDEGRVYRACFVARDDRGFCAAQPPASVLSWSGLRATALGFYSLTYCVDIDVAFARPVWGEETEAAEEAHNKSVYVGCPSSSPAVAADPHYEMRIDIDRSSGGDRPVPAGMQLVTLSQGNRTRVELRWTPTRGTEGSSWFVCLVARPMERGEYGAPTLVGGSVALQPRCLKIMVQRCRYCVQGGGTLAAAAKSAAPGADWLALWVANGNDDGDSDTAAVEDPDVLAGVNMMQVINVGPVYGTKGAETLEYVAARFRTSVARLLDLNPDVVANPQNQPLPAGQELCLMPCTL